MRVLFDLRPRHLVEMQETKIDPVRLSALLLFAVFALVSAFNIVYSYMQMTGMREALEQIKFDQSQAAINGRLMAGQLEELRALRDEVKEYVEFAKEDVPSVEFLSALEAAVPPSMKISSIEMRRGSVIMKGSSLSDQDVIDLGANLGAMRGIVRNVDAPITTHRNEGGRMVSDFTISCGINDLVAAADIRSDESEAAKR